MDLNLKKVMRVVCVVLKGKAAAWYETGERWTEKRETIDVDTRGGRQGVMIVVVLVVSQ